MSEREPKQESHEQTEELTMQEKQDLSALWEGLGTGDTIDPNADNETIRIQLWENTQQALLEKILPKLEGFERNQELENAVVTSPEHSEDRANAEFALIQNYMKQLSEIPDDGYSTTPKLSEKYEYGLNCVMKSALAATLFEKIGIEVNAGKVSGHLVVLVRDSIGNILYADPNDIVGKIETPPERHEQFEVFWLKESDQENLGIPYSFVIKNKLSIGFTPSMLINLDASNLAKHGDASRKLLNDSQEIIATQKWRNITDKLYPEFSSPGALEIAARARGESDRVKQWQEYGHSIQQLVREGFFGKEKINLETYQKVLIITIEAIRNGGFTENVSRFLNNPEQEQLPKDLPADSLRILQIFSDELEKTKALYPGLRNRTIASFVEHIH